MLLRRFLILSLLLDTSCAHILTNTSCESDPINNGMQCYNGVTKKNYFTPYKDTNHFVCMPEDDLQKLITYCKQI